MKKILIFTVTAGNGHNSAANAVKEECQKLGAEVVVVDLLHEFCDNKSFIWVQEDGYALACTYFNSIYNLFFRHFQKSNPKKFYKSPVQPGVFKFYDKVLKYINDFQPDAIFCSHFLPCVMISNLRRLYSVPAKTFSFISDYAVCPFWEAATGIDFLLTPNETYENYMVEKGFTKEQLLPWGLTVNEKFSEILDKSAARKELGLKDGVFTIFVMFGGGFWSGNSKIVKNLLKIKNIPLQIVVANGKNEKDKKKIDKMKVPKNIKLVNYGFAKNVDVIMSASDVIVGKAGGLSVTEALNKKLPMVCCKKLPEQERVNVEMLLKEKAAKQYRTSKQMINILKDLAYDPEQRKELLENIERIRMPFATKRVAEELIKCKTTYPQNDEIDYSQINKNIKKMLKNFGKKKKA